MKMRVVPLVLVLVMLALVLTSCSMESEACEPNPFDNRFAECKVSIYSRVIVDSLTGVCYLYHDGGNDGGMTVLLDADGTPLTYEEAWYQAYQEADYD
jgi:hypothetical protein